MPKVVEQALAEKLAGKTPRAKPRPPRPGRVGLSVKVAGVALTAKEAAFVEHYVIHFNGTKAAQDAGYKCKNPKVASVTSARLLGNERVGQAIQRLIERRLKPIGSTAERVLEEASRLAHSDLRQAFNKDGSLIPIHELPDAFASVVSSIEVQEIPHRNAEGEIEIERVRKIRLWDKPAALALLARHHKIASENVVVKHEGLTASQVGKMSDAELKSALAVLAAQVGALTKQLA